MEIRVEPVTQANYFDVCLLTTNPDGMPTLDEAFICANSVSLAESKYYPDLRPQAIYAGAELVGFILSGPYHNDNDNYWILRYMIDYKHQGKGYGKSALQQFIKQMKEEAVTLTVYLGLDAENTRAVKLYESVGFVYTGVVKDGELVYELAF